MKYTNFKKGDKIEFLVNLDGKPKGYRAIIEKFEKETEYYPESQGWITYKNIYNNRYDGGFRVRGLTGNGYDLDYHFKLINSEITYEIY